MSKDTFCTDETVRRRRTLDELSAHKREGLWGNSSVPEPVLAAEQEAVGKYSSAIRPGAEREKKKIERDQEPRDGPVLSSIHTYVYVRSTE